MIKFADLKQTEEIPAAQANRYWPQSIIKFYEERLEWVTAVHFGLPIPLTETIDIPDQAIPESVLCKFFFRYHVSFLFRCSIILLFLIYFRCDECKR